MPDYRLHYWLGLSALLVIPLCRADTTTAAAAEFEAEQPANYAFAAYMGSGLYAASDASLFVMNVPTTFNISSDDSWRLRLTTSAGFFNYGGDQIRELELPDSIGTLTVIPGVEKWLLLTNDLILIPHLDYGIAHNFASGDNAHVYSIGLQSLYQFEGLTENNLWINQVLFAGARTFKTGQVDNYVKLLTGFDYSLSSNFRLLDHRVRATMYGSVSWAHNGVDYVDRWRNGAPSDLVYELGFTMYAPRPYTLLMMDFDRIGFGYKDSEFGGLWRLFIGTPF